MKAAFIIFMLFTSIVFSEVAQKPFQIIISEVPSSLVRYTWHAGCPVKLKDLCYLRMSYWGFDNKPHLGSMIINKSLVREVTHIFKSLYEHQFPIEQMELMDKYKGNDGASMLANNTSAFNCRDLTGLPGTFSQHSYGRAIDINPRINPYVSGKVVLPQNGMKFRDRNKLYPGKIMKNNFIYQLFSQSGWDWAGNWYDLQDYQHFEKRAHGKKRNPYGNKLN